MKKIHEDFIFYALAVLSGLLWLYILVTPSVASACSNWISESEFQKSLEGLPAKAGCKKQEKCFCYDGVDLAISKIGYKEIDDRSKPIYEYADFETYEYQDIDTEELIKGEACPNGFEVSRSENDCQKLLGYEQKLIEGLVVDEERKATVIAQREQRKLERIKKKKKEKDMQKAFQAWKEEMLTDDNRVISPEEARQRVRSQRGGK